MEGFAIVRHPSMEEFYKMQLYVYFRQNILGIDNSIIEKKNQLLSYNGLSMTL